VIVIGIGIGIEMWSELGILIGIGIAIVTGMWIVIDILS